MNFWDAHWFSPNCLVFIHSFFTAAMNLLYFDQPASTYFLVTATSSNASPQL